MYVNPNPYNISESMKMHDHCDHCGTKYKMEPNFFFGAMYVSYGLAVLIGILIFLVGHFALQLPVKTTFIAIVVILMVLMPWVTRLSRNIYINMFIGYDPDAASGGND